MAPSRAISLLALSLLCSCLGERPNGPAGSDGGGCSCPQGQTCDPTSGACATALAEGEACDQLPGADAGLAQGICGPGLVCGAVGDRRPDGQDIKRCSVECNASNQAQRCGAERSCFGRPGATGGFCASSSLAGQPCDIAQLRLCKGSRLSCVVANAGDTAGRCFTLCDPTSGQSPCAAAESCAALFPADPATGLCVAPAADGRCDYSKLEYCAAGDLCVRPTADSAGFCHRQCAGPQDCPGGSCVEPIAGYKFCVSPVARCTATDPSGCPACDSAADKYCAAEDLCVKLGQATVCKQDCTASSAVCPSQCAALAGSDRKACL